jgi:hypothetical protein
MDPANADAPKSRKPERACSLCYDTIFPVIHSSNESLHSGPDRGGTIMPLRHSPARPRIPQHSISTSPVTTPAVERVFDGGLGASPSSATMLSPSSTWAMGTSPSGNTILSSASSQSGTRFPPSRSNGTDLATARTVTSLDSQRTVQPNISSDLSSLTSNSQSSRPRSLDVGRRFAAASALVQTIGVTAKTKVTGRGKGRRVSLVSERKKTGGDVPASGSREEVADEPTLGKGAAAHQLSELLGRSPK